MISVLVAIALKSLLLSAATLGLLAMMKHRSAAERSWVAHIGLLALVIMAFAPLALPQWTVETPALLSPAPADQHPIQARAGPAVTPIAQVTSAVATRSAMPAAQPSALTISPAAAASALYALPAALLLMLTLLALSRLIALRARADVLVDGHWLSALAHAQRRMGFKHGTALLTSNELASPISWGLMRPVILLNARAVEASGEAEAIIAHELAHVARMDWAKLLLARIATALFWFNPLVWVLAREAHQLREEAADDAVLAADIADTDYAQLLVGVARHECPGLLLGAHGVAPSKSSLARRVARVLDGRSVRGPVARSFAVGVFAGAVIIAAPLAAVTFAPARPAAKLVGGKAGAHQTLPPYYSAPEVATDLPHIIASGVSTSVATAAAAMAPVTGKSPVVGPDVELSSRTGRLISNNGVTVATAPSGARITVYPPNAQGLRRVVAVAPSGATAVTYADPRAISGMAAAIGAPPLPPAPPTPPETEQRRAIERAIEMKAIGMTPEYVAAMKSALPQLRLTGDDLIELKGVGVTPEFIQELVREGYRNVSAEDITGAYAVGIRPDYIRAMAAAGYDRIPLEQLTEMRAVGVTPSDVERFRRAGFTHLDVDELVQAKTLGITPEEIKASRDDR
jgi:bla regulator protein BlaR1